jgi:hypothetical protein
VPCPHCNTSVRPGARTCPRCGKRLEAEGAKPADRKRPVPLDEEGFAIARGSFLDSSEVERGEDPLESARRSAGDLGELFRALPTADRWAAGGAVALLGSLALPWLWTRAEEELIGLFAAWPAALLGAAVVALIYLRTNRTTAQLGERLRIGQLAAAAGSLLYSGSFVAGAHEEKVVRAAGRLVTTALAQAEVGAYLGVACAAVAAVASAAGLLPKRR